MPVFIICWAIIIGFVVVWYVVAKLKQRKEVKSIVSTQKDLPNVNVTSISLGYLGNFDTKNIEVDYLLEDCAKSENKAENEKLANEKFVEIKNLIENHSQYIINYFMSMPFAGNGIDENWDDAIFTKEQKSLGEEKLQLLRGDVEKKINDEIKPYLKKDTTLDIAELYKKYLPYFDYDAFIKTIELEYLHIESNGFSIQLSDKNMDLFCAAYESFDMELKGWDWHNF